VAHPARVAAVLWLTFAIVVWNVVFDRVLVIEGREYVYAAAVAANESRPYVRANDWMRAAQERALWIASATGATVVVIGLAAITIAIRRAHAANPNPNPEPEPQSEI
jgi:hypothetical protein